VQHSDTPGGAAPFPDAVEHLDDRDWFAVRPVALDVAGVEAWVRQPTAGAVVTFVGTVRDRSHGRTGVSELVYEAYDRYALSEFARVVATARRRWPTIERVAVHHRTGRVLLGEDAVVVAVSSPHRDEAFPATAFVIDTVKAVAPIWKLERWEGGESWSTDCRCVDADARAALLDPVALGSGAGAT